ncbi:histidine phosphatase family protein [Thiomicrospira microaerophila]|uniref:SixA phosphatase family protein n=1 Tax=Thiomicrospira microaerophila TaxID=406020 RepID=UPI00200E6E8C|nr:histidine phosphatase family protein [Thiomicrospira microaerophila]UQB42532.1 histidine phosphatase family protein [Thiomicrospira microaerophila]
MTNLNASKVRQLLLWRHAKSDWSNPQLIDHDRPLAPRGKRAAKMIARWIIENDRLPDKILCSSAKRTQQTLKRLENALPALQFDLVAELYHAEIETLLEMIENTDPTVKRLMLVGHNPGFEALVLALQKRENGLELSSEKIMPTGAIAEFNWLGNWSDGLNSDIQLQQIIRPRDLIHSSQG